MVSRLAAVGKIKITFECVAVNNCGIKLKWFKERKRKKKRGNHGVEYKRAFKSITHSRVLVMWEGHFLNFLFQLKIVIYYI